MGTKEVPNRIFLYEKATHRMCRISLRLKGTENLHLTQNNNFYLKKKVLIYKSELFINYKLNIFHICFLKCTHWIHSCLHCNTFSKVNYKPRYFPLTLHFQILSRRVSENFQGWFCFKRIGLDWTMSWETKHLSLCLWTLLRIRATRLFSHPPPFLPVLPCFPSESFVFLSLLSSGQENKMYGWNSRAVNGSIMFGEGSGRRGCFSIDCHEGNTSLTDLTSNLTTAGSW